jgi:hypothetical protein
MKVADRLVAEGTVPVSAPLAFTANDCLNIGITLGSPVSFDYREKAPFKFNGMIERVHMRYTTVTLVCRCRRGRLGDFGLIDDAVMIFMVGHPRRNRVKNSGFKFVPPLL